MRAALIGFSIALVTGCSSMSPKPPAAAVSDLAPTGTLRAAINVGNAVLAARNPAGGDPSGISVDLARAAEIAQSPAYVQIEGAYLVKESSPLRSNDEVDRKGHRVVVARNSAYDLHLTRALKQAEIVRTTTSAQVVDTFVKENYEVAAGVKQQLENDARRVPGVRLLPGRFMVIHQAMASRRGKEAGARYVREFIEEMKSSGFVAKAIERHQQPSAVVAAPGDPK
jgi:polar amino acid transport system substrate-binding protein